MLLKLSRCYTAHVKPLRKALAYVKLRLVSPAMESPNAVSYLVFPKSKGVSKVALFMRMKFVNSASSDTRSSNIRLHQRCILAYDTACIILIFYNSPSSTIVVFCGTQFSRISISCPHAIDPTSNNKLMAIHYTEIISWHLTCCMSSKNIVYKK